MNVLTADADMCLHKSLTSLGAFPDVAVMVPLIEDACAAAQTCLLCFWVNDGFFFWDDAQMSMEINKGTLSECLKLIIHNP